MYAIVSALVGAVLAAVAVVGGVSAYTEEPEPINGDLAVYADQ
jgi:hypothetical protein